ncbi:glycosyltransferase family 2 protein [Candidatus Woesearchaeota archaeon]|jgi:glycosyltransferase involved in cell wall biosynthesis|nr:glycosyltransferase family 2 protein [Candidatus Woesearchaeota archaeon]MBT4368829.1 glycosyltransferase family 2 protein [Candidatus Woesearchaeota archaeon]MBT4712118.1 glycosyltransferase family 2 protein [Candidatus Woesearchaeota archaeon]MBT6639134.1 glycosyltransferase family 2 protein [Candidatus Woesearchaeota archaeon]MBT7134334.1 glycosyltransferase family 2 protein [Candidatus Woesearchaeota archaeon]
MKYKNFSITAIVPVYNEENSVKEVIEHLKKVMQATFERYEIVVVNDCSKDKSKEILQDITGIHLINNPYNLGYSASIKRALQNSKADYVVITDADMTYPVEDIPKLAAHLEDYDMVVGSRTGKNVSIPLMRRPAKAMLNKLAKFVCNHDIPDLNSGLRIFDRKKAMQFYAMYPSRFSFTSTITLAFLTNDYPVKYEPINYYKRRGKSTMKPKDFLMFISLINRIIFYFKPLKFFLIPGFVLLLGGLGFGGYQISTGGLGETPVTLILVGIQLIFLGFVADLIVKTRGH